MDRGGDEMITTYDFGTKSFGHASMLVGPWCIGGEQADQIEIDAALKTLTEARVRLYAEQEQMRKGKPKKARNE
jgi:hypothetical protein